MTKDQMLERMINGSSSAADRIETVTFSTFRALVLQGHGPIVVEFMSYGCSHCHDLEPVLEQVAEMVKDRISICRVNIGIDADLAEEYEIQGTPTLVMFRDGVELGRGAGPIPNVPSLLKAVTHPFESYFDAG